jgi:hypothetical protein
MTLNQKQLKQLVEISVTAGRLNELNRLEGYVPSATLSRRKSILKNQIRDLLGKEEKKAEEQKITINVDLSGAGETKTEKKEKSFLSTIKDLLSVKEDKDDDNDEFVAVIQQLIPESKITIGKVVTEL